MLDWSAQTEFPCRISEPKIELQVRPVGQTGNPISLVASLDSVPVKCCVPLLRHLKFKRNNRERKEVLLLFRRSTQTHTTCQHTTYPHTALQHTSHPHAQLSNTELANTQLSNTPLTHTHTHTTYPHTHNSITNSLPTDNSPTHHLLTHNFLRHTHTTYSHKTCSHTQFTHAQLTHTHTHNLLTHTTCRDTTYPRGTWWHRPSLRVAGVVLDHIDVRFAWQVWHLWDWCLWWRGWVPFGAVDTAAAAAVCVAGAALGNAKCHFAWEGLVFGEIDFHVLWQAWR